MKHFKIKIILIAFFAIAGYFIYRYSFYTGPVSRVEKICSFAIIGGKFFDFRDRAKVNLTFPDIKKKNGEEIYFYTKITLSRPQPICMVHIKDDIIIEKKIIHYQETEKMRAQEKTVRSQ